jgi:hypothetical protein
MQLQVVMAYMMYHRRQLTSVAGSTQGNVGIADLATSPVSEVSKLPMDTNASSKMQLVKQNEALASL